MDRRTFLKTSGLLIPGALRAGARPPVALVVNDVHSRLNRTVVDAIERPESLEALAAVLSKARVGGTAVSVSGGRHSMGGQQFAEGATLLDMRGLNRVLAFDAARGLVHVEAGIEWPDLMLRLSELQPDRQRWGIVQKQTGADRFTLGGSLASNVHGRGLTLRPIVADIESFVLMDASGEIRTCSRAENADLFKLAIGGYGLFGIISSVMLRLAPRKKVERRVEIREVDDLNDAFNRRIAEGYLYGDFQFATDPKGGDFLRRGVFSCYRPVPEATPIPSNQKSLSLRDWGKLYYYGHRNKRRGFALYARHYLKTDGQIYWSDTHQLASYVDGYHGILDRYLGAQDSASEMITEIYVPREALGAFLAGVHADFRRHDVNLVYGTIRLIERDEETFLAWARERWACVIFNLHTTHTAAGILHSAAAFRRLIDLAIRYGGSYYLTYHRWATRQQLEACYPQFRRFLELKRQYDPEERFQSDWYRHCQRIFDEN